ncbi:MAG: hypothetical protein IT252_03135 [Chitinophagaceae bacterium]|nr:hypothetical protein [Chitinophagaceae bacterium]
MNLAFFSGFSPAKTRSAPILALLLGQPRFLLLAQDSKNPENAKTSNRFFIQRKVSQQ